MARRVSSLVHVRKSTNMRTESSVELLKSCCMDVPDFPKKGIIFKDITPLLQERSLFSKTNSSGAMSLVSMSRRSKRVSRRL